MNEIHKAAVLGAGVMGAQIAAHLANAGLEVLLFDLDEETARKGLARAAEIKPAAFYERSGLRKIEALGIDGSLSRIAEADWVCEAIPERLDWKRKLFAQVRPHIAERAVVSTNTSGLPAADVASVLDAAQRRRFLVTHFFNPPRYLRLLELVPLKETDQEVFEAFREFAEAALGKAVVAARDTPNFIANRVGVHGVMRTLQLARETGLSVVDADQLTGTLIGRPKSATFRTADVVGLDTLLHVTQATYEACAGDPWREVFRPPECLTKLVERGSLGQKASEGFYRKERKASGKGSRILALDLETLDYGEIPKSRFGSLQIWRRWKDTGRRLNSLFYEEDQAGAFLARVLGETLVYASYHLDEIAGGRIEVLDRAMRWGFLWELGPFEVWDALDPLRASRRMRDLGLQVPDKVLAALDAGMERFYRWNGFAREVLDLKDLRYGPVEAIPGCLDLGACRRGAALEEQERQATRESARDAQRDSGPAPGPRPPVPRPQEKGVLYRSWSASLIQLPGDVGCVEFHSVLQPLLHPVDRSIIEVLLEAPRLVRQYGLRGLVISHEGEHFCAGANLQMILELAKSGDAATVEEVAALFQNCLLGLRRADFPVVAAPFGFCFGGGLELAMACDRIVAHAELYAGLVEAGVGVVPAGGGCLRMLARWIDRLQERRPGPFPPAQKAFETVAFAKICTSAAEARRFGFLVPEDRIEINRHRQLEHARRQVLELAEDYQAPEEREDLPLPGRGGLLAMRLAVEGFLKAGKISEHDALIGAALARIFCGEALVAGTCDTEADVLARERREFAELCLTERTQQRLEHMLKTGRPLRN